MSRLGADMLRKGEVFSANSGAERFRLRLWQKDENSAYGAMIPGVSSKPHWRAIQGNQ